MPIVIEPKETRDALDAVMSDSAATAVLHKAEEGGYWCSVPVVPGCVSQGDTWEEAKAMIADALEGIVETLKETGSLDQILDPALREAIADGKPVILFFAEQNDSEHLEIPTRS